MDSGILPLVGNKAQYFAQWHVTALLPGIKV